MTKEELQKLDILSFFNNNSILTFYKIIGNEHYYKYSDQKTGSVAVNPNKKIFFDHRSGVGGGIIKAYQLFYNQSIIDFSLKTDFITTVSTETKILSISSVKNIALKKFFTEKRKIDKQYLKLVKEITYEFNEKVFFTIGWPNINGGYNTQNVYIKRVLGVNGVSVHLSNKKPLKINVFEAYFDYLAYLTHTNDILSDALILNSTSFIENTIELNMYDEVYLYFDNDAAGNIATDFYLKKYDKAKDKRFYHCKDYNDFIKL